MNNKRKFPNHSLNSSQQPFAKQFSINDKHYRNNNRILEIDEESKIEEGLNDITQSIFLQRGLSNIPIGESKSQEVNI